MREHARGLGGGREEALDMRRGWKPTSCARQGSRDPCFFEGGTSKVRADESDDWPFGQTDD